ncbi:MAG: DegT/DnrJ/EryC1/StrS family aminotransferase [Cyclobacteriaceae bacterium]|nr:DegT/DnrJ/EryC1/StrS family aminotransferase [Cyclobacteriaceae bacterium]
MNIKYIPFRQIHPALKQEILVEFERFYDDQDYILGRGLARFEAQYANFNQVEHAIGVGNGHDALLIILKCLGIGKGDEVLVPAHTFIATVLPIIHVGATPVLVDIDENTMNIQVNSIEKFVNPKTSAIVPVHLYGNPCEMDELMTLAKSRHLHIIEDNAQAQGATFKAHKTASMGIMNFTSYYPTKNIGAFGDAGLITTNDAMLAAKARACRNYGRSGDSGYTLAGVNSRMDELQARLLYIKLKYLEQWNAERKAIAELYESHLLGVEELQMQTSNRDCCNVRHIFPIITKNRDALRLHLKSSGIETLIHYETPLHLHHALKFLKYKKGDFPHAEKVCKSELSLPIYPGLKEAEVRYICEQIKNFCELSLKKKRVAIPVTLQSLPDATQAFEGFQSGIDRYRGSSYGLLANVFSWPLSPTAPTDFLSNTF